MGCSLPWMMPWMCRYSMPVATSAASARISAILGLPSASASQPRCVVDCRHRSLCQCHVACMGLQLLKHLLSRR